VYAGRKGTREDGVGLQCKAGMQTDGKNPLPRETRVTHFGGATPFGGASAEGPAGRHDRDCSPQVLPITATPAVIHAGEYLSVIRTHS
jgi:hypothetical protein